MSRAVTRFWEARSKGRTISIDEALGLPPGSADHDSYRRTTIRVIAAQAARLSRSELPDPSEAPTLIPAPAAHDSFIAGGPIPQIEGYELVYCLGRGGMGAVYEGYQQSTGRRVAVKFMLDSAGASDAARKRFEREVEVVALLQHPSIVSVIDSGVRKGRYYYVMEYVPGRALDAAMPPGTCPVRPALALMVKVCEAVDYAHQRGVLHRDLKPGNIIVDDQGAPHLLDFGLAKVLDSGSKDRHGVMGLTVSGPDQIMGTVAYMSPEQALGKHDQTSVRTDTYTLGAITYELLTGELPCPVSGSLREVLDGIISQDPKPASALRRELSGDLDAVLLRALEKDPEKRYATAGAFATDLARALAGKPVEARRVSTAGRAWRWVRRNRAISSVAAAGILTIAIVSTVLIARIIRESKIAAKERDLAQENFNRFRSFFESVDPEKSPGFTVLQLLQSATKSLDDSPPNQDLAEAQLREVLGGVYRKFGEYGRASSDLAKALAIRERQAAGRDDAAVAEDLHNLAASLWWDGSYDKAQQLYSRSLAMRRRLFKDVNPLIATSVTHLAACWLRMGHIDKAQDLYQEALDIRRRLYGAEHEEVAQALNNLAKCYLESDDFGRAEPLFREAQAMIRRLRGDAHLGTAAASQNLADCLLRRAEAAEIAGDAVAAREAGTAARENFELALSIRSGVFPNGHHLIAGSKSGLALAELRLGNTDRADTLAHESVEMYKKTRRADHPDLADGLETLGLVLEAQGKHADAAQTLAQALDIAEHARPRAEFQVCRLRGERALTRARSGPSDEDEAALVQSLAEFRERRGDASPASILAARRLVEFYMIRHQPQRAAEFTALAKLSH